MNATEIEALCQVCAIDIRENLFQSNQPTWMIVHKHITPLVMELTEARADIADRDARKMDQDAELSRISGALHAAREQIAAEYVRGREHEQQARATVENSHIVSLREQRDRLLYCLRHLLEFSVANDPGDATGGYTIRLNAVYRNTLFTECCRAGKS